MIRVLVSLISTLLVNFRSRLALRVEILALRHQLSILQRSSSKRRRLRTSDRILWVWLSHLWPDWRSALLIVRPETVNRWHRQGFRLNWRWKSRHTGRPDAGREIRELIRKMCASNPAWGAPRIHGELLKLGIDVARYRLTPITDSQFDPVGEVPANLRIALLAVLGPTEFRSDGLWLGTGSKKALNPVYNTGSRGSECMPGRFNIITEEVVCGRLKRQVPARRALLPRV